VRSLRTLLSAAVQHGMVVVAAAGNDGGGRQVPAIFDEVVGVEATDATGRLACYSNRADVTAPGGGPTEGECEMPCEGMCSPDCWEDVLISTVMGSPEYPAGFACGAGTSFAAALVSGLAALQFEASGGWQSKEGVDTAQIPQYVFDAIAKATLDGIINVPRTLEQVQE